MNEKKLEQTLKELVKVTIPFRQTQDLMMKMVSSCFIEEKNEKYDKYVKYDSHDKHTISKADKVNDKAVKEKPLKTKPKKR